MCVSGIYALNSEINGTETTVSTGAVDLEIEEYDGNDEPFE